MREEELVTGMVISSMPVGDYDKRLVILTKERGKITAFAKGARRPKSPILAKTQPLAFGKFSVYRGKDAYSLLSCEITNYFAELKERFTELYYGFYFCELASWPVQENEEAGSILLLLYQTILALEKGKVPEGLITAIFELRLMALSGLAPEVHFCVRQGRRDKRHNGAESFNTWMQSGQMGELQGKEGNLHFKDGTLDLSKESIIWFSIDEGGILCPSCVEQKKRAASGSRYPEENRWLRKLLAGTVYTMQYILGVPLKDLYAFSVKEAVWQELLGLMQEYLGFYWPHEFKSFQVLCQVTGGILKK